MLNAIHNSWCWSYLSQSRRSALTRNWRPRTRSAHTCISRESIPIWPILLPHSTGVEHTNSLNQSTATITNVHRQVEQTLPVSALVPPTVRSMQPKKQQHHSKQMTLSPHHGVMKWTTKSRRKGKMEREMTRTGQDDYNEKDNEKGLRRHIPSDDSNIPRPQSHRHFHPLQNPLHVTHCPTCPSLIVPAQSTPASIRDTSRKQVQP